MKLKIDGVGTVTVDDSFSTLPPEEQNRTVEEIATQFRAKVPEAVGDAVSGAAPETAALSKFEEVMSPGGFGEMVAHGASLGFSDEIGAALSAASGRDYDTELQATRDRAKAYRERNPLAAFAGEMLGGVLMPGVGFNQALRATTTLGKIGGLAGAGALAGGVTGFGVGEGGFEERLGDAGRGAAFGAVLSPAIVGAANVAGRGLDALLDVTGLGGAGRSETLANRKILQSLQRVAKDPVTGAPLTGGLGPDDAARALDEMAQTGAEPALMGLGVNPSRLTASAARVPGQGAEIAADFVEAQQLGQGGRIVAKFEDLLQTNKSATTFLDDLNKTQKLTAAPLYERAMASGAEVDTAPLLARITNDLQDAVGPEEAALKRVLSFLVRRTDAGDVIPKTDIASLHKVKIGIDGLIENAGTDTAIGRAGRRTLAQLKAELLALMDTAEPGYAAARAQWAGAMELEDALTAGKEIFKSNPEDLGNVFRSLTPSQQPAFRIGVMDAVKEAVSRAGDGRNKVLALFGNPRVRAQFEAILGPNDFQALVKYMGVERAMSKAGGKVSGNSLTAERMADDADRTTSAVDLLATAITSPRSAIGRLGRMAVGYTQGLNERTAANIVGKMTEADPTKLRAIIEALKAFEAQDAIRMANPLRGAGTYGVGVGGVAAPMGLLTD